MKLIEIQQKDDLFPSGIISPLTGPLGAALARVLSWLGTMQKSEQVMRSGEGEEARTGGLSGGHVRLLVENIVKMQSLNKH